MDDARGQAASWRAWHVAVVRIGDETPVPPAKSEIERREGLVGRMLTASIAGWRCVAEGSSRLLTGSRARVGVGDDERVARCLVGQAGVAGRPGHAAHVAATWPDQPPWDGAAPSEQDPLTRRDPPTQAHQHRTPTQHRNESALRSPGARSTKLHGCGCR